MSAAGHSQALADPSVRCKDLLISVPDRSRARFEAWRLISVALALAGALFPARAGLLTLDEALSAPTLRAAVVLDGLKAALSRPARELRLPATDHLQPSAAAALHVRLRFFETILSDLRYEALNEHMAMAFGDAERARANSQLAAAAVDELQLRYLVLRDRRDAMTTERRMARRELALALGNPGLAIDEALEPALDARSHAFAAQQPFDQALARVSAPAQRDALRLAIERVGVELEQRQASGRALLRKRMDAAFARVDEARARLESHGREADFGRAMATSVDARADWLAGEYQIALLRAWLEATLGAPLAPVQR